MPPRKVNVKSNKKKEPEPKKVFEDELDEIGEQILREPLSVIKGLDNLHWGRIPYRVNYINQVRHHVANKYISRLQAIQSAERSMYLHTFQRRITSLAWHKSRPFLLAVGDKFGNMIIAEQEMEESWNNRNFKKTIQIDGGGAGSSLTAMKFHDNEPNTLFRANMDGTVAKFDIELLQNTHVYHNTEQWEIWFTAMDVSTSTKTMLTGDNKGFAYLFTLDGEKVSETKLHSSKILHCEFNPKLPFLIATSALDTGSKVNHVKLWDLRNLKRSEPLATLSHEAGVNVAHFNPTDGSRLLTSDQRDEIRVYQGPLWDRTQLIKQGHRQFQHLTPIKASWHPLYDIIVIGLYPEKGVEAARTVQFYDADTGKLINELYPPEPAIVSLNEFNPTGEVLASGMGSKLVMWKAKSEYEENESSCKTALGNGISSKVRNVLRGRGATNRTESNSADESDSDLKKKSKRKKTQPSVQKRKTTLTESKTQSKRGKRK